jgi:hypothetical protein
MDKQFERQTRKDRLDPELKWAGWKIVDFSPKREIVCPVEALFKPADTIEQRVTAGIRMADKLTQAILVKGIDGELVPTEAELARRENADGKLAGIEMLDAIKRFGGKDTLRQVVIEGLSPTPLT